MGGEFETAERKVRRDYRDKGNPGLLLRVEPSGAKRWGASDYAPWPTSRPWPGVCTRCQP